MRLLRPKTRLESFLEKAEFFLGFKPMKVLFLSMAFMSLFAIVAFTVLVLLNIAMETHMENNI